MRSAERFALNHLAALCCAVLLAGCSSVDLGDLGKSKPAPVPAPAPAPAAQPTAKPAAAPVPVPEPEAAVSPQAQRAFDEARRAMRANRMADAERGFKAVIQAYPELGGPHANLGVIYRKAGKLPESIAELETAVLSSPKQPLFHNQLGISYREAGKFKLARESYERAIDLDDKYAAATLNLGILNDLYLGDGSRAQALYERYLALTPAGDPVVTKWVADLKNRNKSAPAADKKEKE
jgi:tetratricopeptide (TPR) repeat protein